MEWVQNTITFLLSSDWKYLAIFLSGLVEGAPIIGSLYPGGTISFLIGTYAEVGAFSPWTAMILLIAGNFAGDMFGYYLGRYGHRFSIIKNMLEKEKFSNVWDVFERRLFYFIVLGRLIPVVRSIPSLLAGARQIPVGRYVWYSLGGSALWGFAGTWGGFLLRDVLGKNAWMVIVGVTVIVVVYGLMKKYYKKV